MIGLQYDTSWERANKVQDTVFLFNYEWVIIQEQIKFKLNHISNSGF